jgi:histone-lysine N-methyltransferase SETD2
MSSMVKSEYSAGTDLSPISDDENDAFKTDDSLMTPSTKSTPASENSGSGYKGEKDKVELIHDPKSTIEPEYDHATTPAKSVKQIKTKLEDVKRSPQLWLDAPSAKDAAALEFQEVVTCLYQSKDMGESGQEEIMSCDCRPEYRIE